MATRNPCLSRLSCARAALGSKSFNSAARSVRIALMKRRLSETSAFCIYCASFSTAAFRAAKAGQLDSLIYGLIISGT